MVHVHSLRVIKLNLDSHLEVEDYQAIGLC
jgi:hypothetical protein